MAIYAISKKIPAEAYTAETEQIADIINSVNRTGIKKVEYIETAKVLYYTESEGYFEVEGTINENTARAIKVTDENGKDTFIKNCQIVAIEKVN